MAKNRALKLPKISLSAFEQIVFVFRESFRIIWSINPRLLLIVVVLGGIWGFSTLPNLYLGKLIIDTALAGLGALDKGQAIRAVAVWVILRAAIDFGRMVFSRLQRRYLNLLQNIVNSRLDVILGQKLQSLDVGTVEDAAFKDRFEKIMRQSNNRIWSLVRTLSQFPQDLLGIFSALTPIFIFNPGLFVVLTFLAFPGFLVGNKLVKMDYELDDVLAPKWRLLGWMSSLLTRGRNYMESRLLGNTSFIVKRLEKLHEEINSLQYRLRFFEVKAGTLASLPSEIFDAGLNVWLFIQVILGKLGLGTAQMLFSAIGSFENYLGSILNSVNDMYQNYLYMVDLVWFLNLKSQSLKGAITPARKFDKGVKFKNVWFRYPKTKAWVLKGIDFEIGAKENLAIVGENGAGKTTLIKLLGRFYQPNEGEILVDGKNIFQYKERAFWRRLSVLFQDFETYPFTAYESIGFGDVSRIHKKRQIVAAAKQTGIHDFISRLPKKYDTPLTRDFDGGVQPSGGQWQRIALARVLFREAQIVVLDEPTSSLDPKGEEEIFEKVITLTKERNLILISHRFSTVRRADKIIVLDRGKIIEQGSHEELMKKKGHYAKLYDLQAKWYK